VRIVATIAAMIVITSGCGASASRPRASRRADVELPFVFERIR
jgi:hypothetical protein